MLDVNRPVMLTSGHSARIVCTDVRGLNDENLILALAKMDSGEERAYLFNQSGVSFDSKGIGLSPFTGFSLINKPEELWLNVYRSSLGSVFTGKSTWSSLEAAQLYGKNNKLYVKTIKIEV